MSEPDGKSTGRRNLLIGGAAAAGAAAVGAGVWHFTRGGPLPDPKVVASPETDAGFYRELGRTGLKVSSVGIGAGGLEGPEPILRAVDMGLNYIDTAICYGNSEEVIARALRARKTLRDKLLIATKWDVNRFWNKDRILESLDDSLKRLGVEVIDIMQLHWLGGGHMAGDNGFNRLDNDALYAAMEEAKTAGKVKFFGATSHHENRSKILQYAIDKGTFDMILVKMNVLDFADADLPALLAKAQEKNIGVVAMKSQPQGGKMPPGFENSKWSVYQANLRWCLGQAIDCVVESRIGNDPEAQDEAVQAGKTELTRADGELLHRYATALSPQYCRGCGSVCGSACPDDVAISHVLQFGMYAREYGWPDYAKQLYTSLPEADRWSTRCLDCNACSEACGYGVDAAARVRDARLALMDKLS
jgi:predicted aldo/keto reductase-like oxidoreductase